MYVFFVFDSVNNRYETKEMCDRFVAKNMLENFHDPLNAGDDILFFDEYCNEVTFFS